MYTTEEVVTFQTSTAAKCTTLKDVNELPDRLKFHSEQLRDAVIQNMFYTG